MSPEKIEADRENPLPLVEFAEKELGDLQGRKASKITKGSGVVGIVLTIVGIVTGSALLTVIGLLLVLYAYYRYRSETGEVEGAEVEPAYRFIDDSQAFNGIEYAALAPFET